MHLCKAKYFADRILVLLIGWHRAIAFIFYFNRALAFLVSIAVRTYTWYYFRAHIEIQAIQISPLAGRIFLKGVRYQGQNETISVNNGHITWKYWLRHVRRVDAGSKQPSRNLDGSSNASLPTDHDGDEDNVGDLNERAFTSKNEDFSPRITVDLRGLEWFVYNRSPVYDGVLAAILKSSDEKSGKGGGASFAHGHSHVSSTSSQSTPQERLASKKDAPPSSFVGNAETQKEHDSGAFSPSGSATAQKVTSDGTEYAGLSSFMRLLPIGIQCKKGAMVMGNEHTRCVLVVKFDYAHGFIDARSSGPLDLYKQSFDFELEKFVGSFRVNQDYGESILSAGSRLDPLRTASESEILRTLSQENTTKHALHKLSKLIPQKKSSAPSPINEKGVFDNSAASPSLGFPSHKWLGLSRYLDEDEDELVEQERSKSVEYAQVTTIIDCPKLGMSFFYDVPGKVYNNSHPEPLTQPNNGSQNINGGKPPDWGLNITIGGGLINYGPWADRQRADLQAVFFPQAYALTSAAKPLKPGQLRQSTQFKIDIVIDEAVVLRIHTREESKDWKWKGHFPRTAETHGGKFGGNQKQNKHEKQDSNVDVRPAGWLDLTAAANSYVSYSMDMFAGSSGFENKLSLDIPSLNLSTSVNHSLLLRSRNLTISCDLATPLQWNAQRKWIFDLNWEALELFLLRDHAFLLTDLITDWTTGPPAEYPTFIPFLYGIKLRFPAFKIYLNVNDSNIIDSPAALNANAFMVLGGELLNAELSIPLTNFRPLHNEISFSANVSKLYMELLTPPWNTLSTLLKSKVMARLDALSATGSYTYFTSTSPSQTETLIMDLHGTALTVQLFGFLIRYFISFQKNYFGEDMHFQTLEEYQQRLALPSVDQSVQQNSRHVKASNDLDVILTIRADEDCIVLPCGLYSAETNVNIAISSVLIDLRFTNYYMDLEICAAPLAFTRGLAEPVTVLAESLVSNTQIFIDGLSISGHRLFGLPPTEPTYVCNWDLDVGRIVGECTLEFMSAVANAGRVITFQFRDTENALPNVKPTMIHDVTFLRLGLDSMRLWMHVQNSAVLLETHQIDLDFNDWAKQTFSEIAHAKAPHILLSLVDAVSAVRQRSKSKTPVLTHGVLRTSVDFRMAGSKANFKRERELQQDHIELHDSRTRRTPWLRFPKGSGISTSRQEPHLRPRPPAMAVPPIPEPLQSYSHDTNSSTFSQEESGHPFLSRHHSFLYAGSNSNTTSEPMFAPSPSKSEPIAGRPRFVVVNRDSAEASQSTRRTTPPQSSLAFSSPFDRPYFPLQSTVPDISGLPLDLLPLNNGDDIDHHTVSDTLGEDGWEAPEDDTARTNLFLSFGPGVQAYCSSEAVATINDIISCLQPRNPEQILDDIQMLSVSSVLSEISKQKSISTSLQLHLSVPAIAARLIDSTQGVRNPTHCQAYELSAFDLRTIARFEDGTQQRQSAGVEKSVLGHGLLRRARLTVKGQAKGTLDQQTRLDVIFNNLTVWLARGILISSQLRIKGVEIISLNRRVEYLSALLSGATELLQDFINIFAQTITSQKRRLQILVRSLATEHAVSAGPMFLTTVSYVLRAASSHLRNTDTWKIISRLRFIYMSLSTEDQIRLKSQWHESFRPSLENEVEMISISLNRWRAWDLVQVKTSAFMQEIYGADLSKTTSAFAASSFSLGLNLGSFKAIIDPGPEQNEIEVKQLFISVDSSLRHIKAQDSRDHSKRLSTIALYCDSTSIHLNWELCEIVVNILDLLYAPKPGGDSSVAAPQDMIVEQQDTGLPQVLNSLQFVLALENIDLGFKSINIMVNSLSQSVKASLLVDQVSATETTMNAVLSAQLIATQVSSHLRSLALVQIVYPSVNGFLILRDGSQQQLRTWKGGAFCTRIGLEVHEDALGLLGVADMLLRDELSYLKQKKASIPAKLVAQSETHQPTQIHKSVANDLHVTLLLEEYSISTVLLSSLRYVVRGNVARSIVRSLAAPKKGILADFDIKQHYHSLENNSNLSREEVSGFILPPMNGYINLSIGHNRPSVTISMALERISVKALALYYITSTLSRQEISRFRQDVVRDSEIVKTNYKNLLRRSSGIVKPSQADTAPALNYKVNLIANGLVITATTGKSSKQAARLSLELESISLRMINYEQNKWHKLLFPEISANFKTIKILLERYDGKVGRSCGDFTITTSFVGTSKPNDEGRTVRSFEASIHGPEINLFADTAPIVVDILGYIQQRFKSFSISEEFHTFRARRHRSKSQARLHLSSPSTESEDLELTAILFNSMYALEIKDIQVSWRVGDLMPISPGHELEDLIFSIERIHLSTRKTSAARLLIGNLQLQMVPTSQSSRMRSKNSALLPEVVFNAAYLSTSKDRRLAFQAVGKSVDLRLTPNFAAPASDLQRSIGHATEDLRKVIAGWNASFLQDEQQSKKLFGNKRLSSVLIDADFAGAVVHLQGSENVKTPTSAYSPQQTFLPFSPGDMSLQSPTDSSHSVVLRTPGIAFKIEYQDLEDPEPSLNAEVKVDASSNTLQPTIVPLVLALTSSIQEIVQRKGETPQSAVTRINPTKPLGEDSIRATDPAAILGNCRLNLGLRICKQRFGLTCQPIAKVAAAAEIEDIYITINTVQSDDQNRFFALSAKITRLQASVQHAYSQESTGSFVAEVIELSLMNSRHISDLEGMSAILNLGPMKVVVNARQLHDFFLFRELWLPRDIFQQNARPPPSTLEAHPIMVQRYQQVAAASPFPWNATISIAELNVELDLGSSLGKGSLQTKKLWTSSRKLSKWEQTLCLGFDSVTVESVGRLSCSIGLQNMRLRTSIKWQETDVMSKQTPLIQASIGFQDMHLKAAFEYQTILVATFSALDFIMYNVRDGRYNFADRLVCMVEGDQVQVYCTTQTSAQVVALSQAFQRLVQEKKQAYENSLKDIRRFYRTEDAKGPLPTSSSTGVVMAAEQGPDKTPLQLQTNVVVALKYINVGAYPRSFADSNIFKLNALDASARFSVLVKDQKLQSSLGMSLGQVRVALSPINRQAGSNAFEDISVDDVMQYSSGSRGGTILKVPRVVAVMQTWQAFESTQIEYVFKSTFEGKVEVGWNINRINVIRSMWNSHSRALAARLGKALPQSAVQITGVPTGEEDKGDVKIKKEKITAVVNVPLSKYSYAAREPPVIETPQLRDMGEATPPLEWIGLQRERLPNITHQIIIVPLLEVAKEVEDAYGRILGAS